MSERVMHLRATIPALRDTLLDAQRIGAKLLHRLDPDRGQDILTIEWEGLAPHDVFYDDKALLICRLEELGFRYVSVARLEQALACIPHTATHLEHCAHWVAG